MKFGLNKKIFGLIEIKCYKKFVCPPFTNHADQDKSIEGINPGDHTNLDHPITYDEATDFIQ